MAEDSRDEHSDWHFADDLQRIGNAGAGGTQQGQRRTPKGSLGVPATLQHRSGASGGTQNGGKAGRKRQQSPVTIDALLSRHRRMSGAD